MWFLLLTTPLAKTSFFEFVRWCLLLTNLRTCIPAAAMGSTRPTKMITVVQHETMLKVTAPGSNLSMGSFLYCFFRLTSNVASAKSGLANFRADVSGTTSPEDSLGGLLVASHNADWRPLTGGDNILRLIILVTDAGYNQPGHPFLCKGPNFRPNDGDASYDCTNEVCLYHRLLGPRHIVDPTMLYQDYPSVEQVKAIMSSKKILPIFLTEDHYQSAYQTLLNKLDLGGLSKGISNPSTSIFEVVRDAVGSFVCARVSLFHLRMFSDHNDNKNASADDDYDDYDNDDDISESEKAVEERALHTQVRAWCSN
eukprot:284817809_5